MRKLSYINYLNKIIFFPARYRIKELLEITVYKKTVINITQFIEAHIHNKRVYLVLKHDTIMLFMGYR